MATVRKKHRPDAWDTGELGQDERHVVVADESHDLALDAALDLRLISIRLPRQLIDQYKQMAQSRGVGYQPLMRDVLQRFAKGST